MIEYRLTHSNPADPLPELPQITPGDLVVVVGDVPIWRYGQAFHRLHGSPAGAIGIYDPDLGVVIISSHVTKYHEGQVI